MSKLWRYAVPISAFLVVDVLAYKYYVEKKRNEKITVSQSELQTALQWKPPTRKELIDRLASHSSRDRELDVLIIGGGATGTGCAVDAALRGLNVACVEREDWSSGTSSKSTKLVHGGVRYLEKAVLNLDIEQYKLVEEALHERATVLKIAPHLTAQMPIMLPIYQWYKIPYFWAGSKAYDLVAGGAGLHNSYFLSRQQALDIFPLLKVESLAGAMVYYDGIQNDSRVNLSLALTALYHGAIAANYTKVVGLLKDERTGQLIGATMEDTLTGKRFPVYAKCIINATGPYCDLIRRMDDEKVPLLVQPSSGAHIILPKYICPKNMGLIDPATSDGRVLFLLPWEGAVISGTTDVPSDLTFSPKATGEEIDFIVDEIAGYLSPDVKVTRSEVQAAWSGLRPLVKDLSVSADNAKTESLVRSHLIMTSASGLVTIAGGKWTTFRNMAKETVDHVCNTFHFNPRNPQADTSKSLLIGAHGYQDTLYVKLIQEKDLDEDIAVHLAQNYGDRANAVCEMQGKEKMRRLHPCYSYVETEVRYSCRHEYAETLVDVLGRRMRLAFVDVRAAQQVLPRVVQIMAEEKTWTEQEKQKQICMAIEYLKTMGSEETSGHASK